MSTPAPLPDSTATPPAATADGPDRSDAALARSSALMASGTLVSRVLGLVRTFVQLAAIGGTVEVGAQVFDIANKVPNVFYMLLAGGVLNAVLVPQIVRALKAPDGGKEYVDRLVTVALVVMAGLTVVLTLAAPLVVQAYARFSPEMVLLTTALAYWCLPQVFFYGLYTVLGQVLNAKGSFGPYMWAPVLNNVVAIAGLLVFLALVPGAEEKTAGEWTSGQVALLAGTATLGIVAQALVLFWPLRRAGFRYRPRWGLRGLGFRRAGTVAGWTFAALLVGQAVLLLTTRVATGAGSYLADHRLSGATGASYTTAYLLFMLPHSLVAVSLVTALFTRLSHAAAAGDAAAVRRSFSTGARTVTAAGGLATAGFVALGPWAGTAMAAGGRPIGLVLVAMTLGLVPFSVTYLASRVFYAYEDARTPFVVALVTAVVMAVGDVLCWWLLDPRWTVVGIGAAMSVSNAVGCVLALVLLRRKLAALDGGGIDGARVLRTGVRVLLVALVSGGLVGAAAWLLAGDVRDQLGSAVVTVGGGLVLLVLFGLLSRALRVGELTDLVAPLLRRLPGPLRRLAR